jgi:hypothetical protein
VVETLNKIQVVTSLESVHMADQRTFLRTRDISMNYITLVLILIRNINDKITHLKRILEEVVILGVEPLLK